MKNSSTYNIWQGIKTRCLNPRSKPYSYYGGRGIKICDRWLKFNNFLEDMGEKPEGKSIDRFPNNNGNYEPGNCRWATPMEQANNRNDCRHKKLTPILQKQAIELFSTNHSLGMIGMKFGISRQAIKKFLNKNGVNTAKKRFQVNCFTCGKPVFKAKCQLRNLIHPFCSRPCYYAWIKNPAYNEHRQGQRIAREVMEETFGPTHYENPVYHHEDSDNDNNNPNNILIFESQSNHMKYHRSPNPVEAFSGKSGKLEQVKNPKK